MKLRNKIAAITAAAMLAFTGVGFAAWVFGNEAEETASASNHITAAVDLQGLTVDEETFKLVLDQPAKSYNQNGLGVHWEDNNGNALSSITLTPTIEFKDGTYGDVPVYEWVFDAECDHADLDSYIKFTVTNQDDNGTLTHGDTLAAFVYDLPEVVYADNKEPSTLEEYNTMVSALNGKSVSFSFKLNITDNE